MRKRSKYRPKPVLTDPVAYVVESSTPLVDHGTYVIDWKLKNHMAMETLMKGLAKKPHLDTVVAARNVTEGLMVTLGGADVDGTLGAVWGGFDGRLRPGQRWQGHGTPGCRDAGLA